MFFFPAAIKEDRNNLELQPPAPVFTEKYHNNENIEPLLHPSTVTNSR